MFLRAVILIVCLSAILCIGLVSRAQSPLEIPHSAKLSEQAQAKQELNRLLLLPEFRNSGDTSWSSLYRRAGRAVSRTGRKFLGWLGEQAPGVADATRPVSVLLTSLIVILFLFLVAYVIARISRHHLTGKSQETQSEYAGPDSPQLALDEASRAAASGDFRSAIRLVYLASLLKLDELDLIRFDRTGTNWEYLSALGARPDLQQALKPTTISFDRKWYGHEVAIETDYHGFLSAYRIVESAGAAK